MTLDLVTLLYTYISRFSVNPHYQQQLYLRPPLIALFNLSHKRLTFAFIPESGYTLGFAQRIAHKAHTAKQVPNNLNLLSSLIVCMIESSRLTHF